MNKKVFLIRLILSAVLLVVGVYIYYHRPQSLNRPYLSSPSSGKLLPTKSNLPPMAIESLRSRNYPGSDLTINQTLVPGINYHRYIASYLSDGLKIYGLLTVPDASPSASGWPAIVFIHGHLDPKTYITTERYVAYQDGFARSGYVTFKPDLRGHGQSEGLPVNSNFSADYMVDALNAVSSVKKYPGVDAEEIGMWGHSMGGGIVLRSMVVSKDIKAGVIWGGVVGDYSDLLERFVKRIPWIGTAARSATAGGTLSYLEQYGSPSAGSTFWKEIDPYNYLKDISGPVQLDHGTADTSVPVEFSQHLYNALNLLKKPVEFYEYPGSDHNIAQDFPLAMRRSVNFFDKYLKGGEQQ